MNRKIDIQFVEEVAVEILAVPASVESKRKVGRRQFWLGWQLFGAE